MSNINAYFVLKSKAENKVITQGKHNLISHVQNKLVHLLKGKPASTSVEAGTIVQLIELQNNIGTFYIPSEDSCYLDVFNPQMYEKMIVYPFSNKLWNNINEA